MFAQSHWCAGKNRIAFHTHSSSNLFSADQLENTSILLRAFEGQAVLIHGNISDGQADELPMKNSFENDWSLYLDMVMLALLAMSAMLANLGLLSLAGRTQPALQATGTSFSNNGAPLNWGISNSGQTRNDNSQRKWRLFCCISDNRDRSLTEPTSPCYTGLPNPATMQRYPSAISLCRSSFGTLPNSNFVNCGTVLSTNHHHRSTRSRRHRRYLRGLFGLSVSNLTISFSLMALFIGLVVERFSSHKNPYWLYWLSIINIGLADLAQAVEIGAVLWIALERTFGIHWFKERRLSSSKNVPALTRHSVGGTVAHSPKTIDMSRNRERIDQSSFNAWMLTFRRSIRSEKSVITQVKNIKRNSSSFRVGKQHCCSCRFWPFKCVQRQPEFSNNVLCQWLLKRSRCLIRLFLSFTPLTLSLLAILVSTATLVSELAPQPDSAGHQPPAMVTNIVESSQSKFLENNRTSRHAIHPTIFIIYYTDSMAASLVIGQFLLPLAILITTNLLIYRKVASRDKRFFTRQSSDTSKSSFLSNNSDHSLVFNGQMQRKLTTNQPTNAGVPLLRVLESSTQDLHSESLDDHNMSNCHKINLSKGSTDDLHKNLLAVPCLHKDSTKEEDGLMAPCSGHRRRSASLVDVDFKASSHEDNSSADILASKDTGELNLRKTLLSTPQQRRKSSSDLFGGFFQSRSTDQPAFATSVGRGTSGGGEEPILLQMLRRQHRRTLRILIILLSVFVVCRGPRALVLLLGWLDSEQVCRDVLRAYTWLHYVTWWAYTSAVLDTIVYGFWGNRAYRIQLRQWYNTRCTMSSRRSVVAGLC